MLESYQNLLHEVCRVALDRTELSQETFKKVVDSLQKVKPSRAFKKHERAWVLRVLCDRITQTSRAHPPKHDPIQESFLESLNDVKEKLPHLKQYLMRLPVENRLLIVLKDRFEIPMAEISLALGIGEDSLKLARAQTLQRINDWLWESA